MLVSTVVLIVLNLHGGTPLSVPMASQTVCENAAYSLNTDKDVRATCVFTRRPE